QIKGIEKYLRYAKQDEHKTYKWNSTNITKWPICPMQVPQQKDGWSCGLFTLKCIEHWNGKDLSPDTRQLLLELKWPPP
ncbi:Os02g0467500, partial [Oryza sativa Japonica Group]